MMGLIRRIILSCNRGYFQYEIYKNANIAILGTSGAGAQDFYHAANGIKTEKEKCAGSLLLHQTKGMNL